MAEKIDFDSDREVLQAAIRCWGGRVQEAIAIEEMSELTKALCKTWRHGIQDKSMDAVIEEIADVQIMLWQLAELYGRGAVHHAIVLKMERLKERVEAILG